MDTQRLILLFIFGFSSLMLWEAWQKETRPQPVPSAQQQPASAPKGAPGTSAPAAAPAAGQASVPAATAGAPQGEAVHVRTDLFVAEIDTLGATLKRLDLVKHKDSADPQKNFALLGPEHHYEAQGGLTGEGGPNHRTL